MILQIDPRLNSKINEYGCYWMSLLWWGNKLGKYMYTTEEMEALYQGHVRQGWMDENCFIHQPDNIMRDVSVDFNGWISSVPLDFELPPHKQVIEILKFQMPRQTGGGVWTHFTAGDGYGNVTYDAWGTAKTVKEGKLIARYINYN